MDYNFSVAPVDPSQAIAQFSGSAQQNANLVTQSNLQMQQNKLAMQKQMLSQTILGRAMSPNGSGQDWATLSQLIDPAAFQAANSHWQTVKTNQQQDALQAAGSTWAALMNDSPEVAKSITQARIEAMSNQPGGGDKTQLAFLNGILQTIDKDPKVAAAQLGIGLSTMPGGKDAMDAYYKQTTAKPDASKTQAEADYTTATTQPEVALKNAQADQAAADARLKNIEALYKGTGTLTPIEKAAAETDLRNELLQNPQYKAFQIASVAKDAMHQASANGAGDLNLIYNLNKILDPNSVVRESEFANAASTGGLPAVVMSYFKKLDGSGMLPPEVRKQLIAEADKMLTTKEAQIAGIRKGITAIAGRRGLSADNIFYDDPGNTQAASSGGGSSGTPSPVQKGSYNEGAMTITKPDGTLLKYNDSGLFRADLQKLQAAGVF
jgi:hypothetical protein